MYTENKNKQRNASSLYSVQNSVVGFDHRPSEPLWPSANSIKTHKRFKYETRMNIHGIHMSTVMPIKLECNSLNIVRYIAS